ncbi:MAG: GatB/YqeY domain-containing protein [archaeon]
MKKKIKKDMFQAMKEKNTIKKGVLQLVLAGITNKEKELKKELSDSEILSIIQKEIKQTNDSIEMAIKANRKDLIEESEYKIDILNRYLPEQLTGDEISELVDTIIGDTGASSMEDMGIVMGNIMPKIKGKADGSLVNKIVKEKLSSI